MAVISPRSRWRKRADAVGARLGGALVLVFLSLFLVVGLGLLAGGLAERSTAQAISSWPSVEGRIESVRLQQERGKAGDAPKWRATVAYAYEVKGRRYIGRRIAPGYRASDARATHAALAEALSVGRRVAVRYDPAAPRRSALAPGRAQAGWPLITAGAIWTLTVLTAFVFSTRRPPAASRVLAAITRLDRGLEQSRDGAAAGGRTK